MQKASTKKSKKIICSFCDKKFKLQNRLDKHITSCTAKERLDNKDTPTSRLAHKLWSETFKNTGRKKYDFKTFSEHKDYTFFIKFSLFCLDLRIHDPSHYMLWCIDSRLKFIFWTEEATYEKFIKYFLVHEKPLDAVIRSITYMVENTGVNAETFFDSVKPGVIINMLEMGRISPWIIILSPTYEWKLIRRCSQDQVNRYNNTFDKKIWQILKKKYASSCIEIEQALKQG